MNLPGSLDGTVWSVGKLCSPCCRNSCRQRSTSTGIGSDRLLPGSACKENLAPAAIWFLIFFFFFFVFHLYLLKCFCLCFCCTLSAKPDPRMPAGRAKKEMAKTARKIVVMKVTSGILCSCHLRSRRPQSCPSKSWAPCPRILSWSL